SWRGTAASSTGSASRAGSRPTCTLWASPPPVPTPRAARPGRQAAGTTSGGGGGGTGSRPPGTGFQRAPPLVDRLPGSDDPTVTSIQAVLAGDADVGRRVLVLDDLGDWRGLGTALHLLEAGHEVTILTAAPVV